MKMVTSLSICVKCQLGRCRSMLLACKRKNTLFARWMGSSGTPVSRRHLDILAASLAEEENQLSEAEFVPITASESEHHSLVIRPPDQPLNPKTLKVSVLGMPNAGKSTFINAILGKSVLATSAKIDTTTENTLAVRTIGDTQIIFQDTPGIVNKRKASRHGISSERISRTHNSFYEADLGVIVADLTSLRVKDGFLQPEILLTMMKNRHVPTVLVLNKVDKYSKKDHLLLLIHLLTAGHVKGVAFEPERQKLTPMRIPKIKKSIMTEYEALDLKDEEALKKWLGGSEHRLLNKLRFCRGWPHFEEVFVTSAKNRHGIDEIKNYMLSCAHPGSWTYHSEVRTDASPKQIILDAVRAGLLEHLPQEIPYRVIPRIMGCEEVDDGRLIIHAEVVCGKRSHFNILSRKASHVATETQEHLQDVFFLETYVRISPVHFPNMGIK